MSSISFPHPGGFPSSAASASEHDDPFGSGSGFGASASFTINPLSSHPPRTPRASMIAASAPAAHAGSGSGSGAGGSAGAQQQVYGTEIYGEKAPRAPEHEHGHEDEEVDTEDARTRLRAQALRRAEVWKEMLTTSNGRDKAFKLIQYSIKVYLLFHTAVAASAALRKPKGRPWEVELVRRLESTAAGFSLTRKCLILFNWLAPLNSILARHASSYSSSDTLLSSKGSARAAARGARAPKPLLHTVLHAPPPVLLELVQAGADDVATFAKLGLLGARTGARAGRFADWCWFASTLVNLVENAVERNIIGGLQHEVESRLYDESMAGTNAKSLPMRKSDDKDLQRLQAKDYWLKIVRAKLFMDLIFVSYDVFRLNRGKRSAQAFSGLASALLSSAKLYDNHRTTLLKTPRL